MAIMVPQLQFAQTPVVQPRSEMQDFSNALLQAGAMRQERLLAERDRAEKLAAQKFSQDLQTRQMGLQEKADVRAEQQLGMAREKHGVDMAEATAAAQARQREEGFRAEFSTMAPEIQKMDSLQQTEVLTGLMAKHNMLTPDAAITLGQAKQQALVSKQKEALFPLEKKKLQAEIDLNYVQMSALRAKAAADIAAAAGKTAPDLGKIYDDTHARVTQLQSNLDRTKTEIARGESLLAKTITPENIGASLDNLPPDMAGMKQIADVRNMLKGNPTKEQVNKAVGLFRATLTEGLNRQRELLIQEDANLQKAMAIENDLMKARSGGVIDLPSAASVAPAFAPGLAPTPGTNQAPPVDPEKEQMQQKIKFLEDQVRSRETGFTPQGTATPSRVDAALEGARKLPVTVQPPAPAGRPSERTMRDVKLSYWGINR